MLNLLFYIFTDKGTFYHLIFYKKAVPLSPAHVLNLLMTNLWCKKHNCCRQKWYDKGNRNKIFHAYVNKESTRYLLNIIHETEGRFYCLVRYHIIIRPHLGITYVIYDNIAVPLSFMLYLIKLRICMNRKLSVWSYQYTYHQQNTLKVIDLPCKVSTYHIHELIC